MNKYKVVMVDFDGFIVESVDIKDNAFKFTFGEYTDCLDQIMEYHFQNNTTIRYEKFKYIYENILKKQYTKEIEIKTISLFNNYTRTNIISCPFVPGAIEFLDFFKNKVPLYLASVTPLEELKVILEERKLMKYFKGIFGAPEKKTEVFKKIQRTESVAKYQMVFLGDSIGDMNASNEFEISFIARKNKDDFSFYSFPQFDDLFGIMDYLIHRI